MSRIVTLVLVLVAAGAAYAAEPPKTGPAAAIVLPPPKVELPPLPADGSGIWRLHLEDCVPTPLWVVLEVEQGKVLRGVVFPPHRSHVGHGGKPNEGLGAWGEVDTSGLAITQDRLAGRIVVGLLSPWIDLIHSKLRARGGEKSYKPYELKTEEFLTISLEVAMSGHQGVGTWSAEATSGKSGNTPRNGAVVMRREPPLPLPENCDVEIFMPGGLGDTAGFDNANLWLRARMSKTALVRTVVGAGTRKRADVFIPLRKTDITFAGHTVRGRLEGVLGETQGEAFSIDLDGIRVGRNLCGKVSLRRGDYQVTTPWRGFLDVTSWTLPMEDEAVAPRHFTHDLKPDPELAAAALQESVRPVLPGEPGKTGFWTWRNFVPGAVKGPVSVIHPPSFDVEEMPGAARYRFEVKPAPGASAQKEFNFEADKPWRPLEPIWKDLPPGEWTLTVSALNSAGKVLPGPMRMGVGISPDPDGKQLHPLLEKPEHYQKPGRVVVETKPIKFEKRLCYSGPYNTTPRSWREAAAGVARWQHSRWVPDDVHFHLCSRGLAPSYYQRTGGEGIFIHEGLWAELALRGEAADAGSRLQAEELIQLWLEAHRLHQRSCQGLYHYYKGYTPCTHWLSEQLLDAWVQTGDPAWKERCLDYGRALVKLQNKNGTFLERRRRGEEFTQEPLPGPDRLGYCTYSLSYARQEAQWGCSELLYVLGRLRRDLGTDEFLPAERLAHRWMIEVAVRERFFPLYNLHSHSTWWPQRQHSWSALYFSRYLLEAAPVEMRDLGLAEEVARWAEDYLIEWRRFSDGQSEQAAKDSHMLPSIAALDRGIQPAAVNLLAAIVFEQLGQATGNRLWSAKGEALAGAVLAAQHPETLRLGWSLHSEDSRPATGQVAQLLREYAALKEAKKR